MASDASEREKEALKEVHTMINNAANLFPRRTRQIWREKIDALVRAVERRVREAHKEAALSYPPTPSFDYTSGQAAAYRRGRLDAAAAIEALKEG